MEDSRPVNVVICSDSYSASSLISARSSRQDILHFIILSMYRVNTLGSNICFLWVPAHVGVVVNEEVDRLANEAMKLSYIEMNIPLCKEEVKAIIRTVVKGKWQVQRNEEERGTHLYQIQNKIGW